MDVLRAINLGIKVNGRKVLENINIYIQEGQTVVLFGPNGSGKSSLISTIIGNPKYKIYDGRILYKGRDITDLPTDERVKMGIGIGFQTPPKVSGVKLREVLKYCARIGKTEDKIDEYVKLLNMGEMLERNVNEGFSGGEVKRSELLQLLLLNPDFVMLDEPDSGVDLENIAILGKAIKTMLQRDKPMSERKKSGLIITHTGHILKYVDADYGMILHKGRIGCIGNPYSILESISKDGYEGCIKKCLRFPNSMRDST
ncbi:MAG TPA: ABC transporter ATP-binding protein [Archaeoglobaceae archaeon]|nr:ABC transporter ATP-binding protein [Archaeoglobaceae archaeon]